MSKFRAFLWTSVLGGSLLMFSASALASGSHGRHGVSNHKHRFELVRVNDNGRGTLIRTVERGPNHFHSKGYYVRRHGRYYWVKDHRHYPRKHWKRYHHRGWWGHGPAGHSHRTVIIEGEAEVQRESSSIRIGPEELSVIIPLPW